MPKYRLLCKSFMAKTPGGPVEILQAGTIIEYDGIAGLNLEPLDVAEPAPLVPKNTSSGGTLLRLQQAKANRERKSQ